jgi:hypothetical protein
LGMRQVFCLDEQVGRQVDFMRPDTAAR